jgi:2-hydroxychromene-2-carboxylate isomerase
VSAEKAGGVFYFDVVSPFAYLCFARLKKSRLPITLEYRPVLFAAMLNSFGQKGPAEIASKRIFTYEQCTWLAERDDIPFMMPSAHPFNPLKYLRLIVGLGSTRAVIDAVFSALFTTGRDPEDPATFEALVTSLEVHDVVGLIGSQGVKAALRANTEAAIKAQVFGVPTIVVADRLFWGADSLPMLASYLKADGSFDTKAMQAARSPRVGASRL